MIDVPGVIADVFPDIWVVSRSGSFFGTYVLPVLAWITLFLVVLILAIFAVRPRKRKYWPFAAYCLLTFMVATVGFAKADVAYIGLMLVLMVAFGQIGHKIGLNYHVDP